MKTNKADSLNEQIEETRKDVESWPEWMQSIAYFSSTDASSGVKDAPENIETKARPKD